MMRALSREGGFERRRASAECGMMISVGVGQDDQPERKRSNA
jgi:hypothetical protein